MPEEPLTPEYSDQTDLTPEAPESGEHTTPETTDWEKRYKDAQAWGTQQSQRASELEQYQQWYSALSNPETQAQALQMLGLELDDEGQPDPYADEEDPSSALQQEVAQIKAQLAQRDEAQQLAQLESEINSGIKAQAAEAGLELSPQLQKLLFNNVIASPPTDTGDPDIAGAFEEITGLRDQWIKGYRETKRRAPSAPIPGTPGNPDHKFGDPKSRLALANLIAEEAMQRNAD